MNKIVFGPEWGVQTYKTGISLHIDVEGVATRLA
jgi:hypothetical protein